GRCRGASLRGDGPIWAIGARRRTAKTLSPHAGRHRGTSHSYPQKESETKALMKRLCKLVIVPAFFLGLTFGALLPVARALPEKIYRALDLFSKVLFIVEKDYVEPVDGQNLVYGAIKGMLGTLDPYTVFLTPDVYKELKVDTMGRFGGVGIEITLQ